MQPGANGRGATGAQRLVEVLASLPTEVVFGLPGVHNLAIWRALAGSGIRLIGVRHEQAAAYAADGYARASGRLGVCIVTTGPGAANTLAATGEAMASGSPVLIIATDIHSTLRRPGVYRGVLHETRDQQAMFAPVTKHAITVSVADDIATTVLRAARIASDAPTGPVYVGIPTDLLTHPAVAPEAMPAEAIPMPTEAQLDRAVALLADAENPLIWVGGGGLRSGAGDAVGELATRLAAPVLTTYMGRGVLPPNHPCHVPGSVLLPEVGRLWDEADIVVAIGTDFDGTMTQNWLMPPPPLLVAINIDESDAGKNYVPDLTLVGDARQTTSRLAERVRPRAGLDDLRARLHDVDEAVRQTVVRDDAHAARFLDVMSERLPDDAVVVLDMCIPAYWLVSFHPVPAPRRLHYPVGWGTLGFGFPASIGSAASGAGRTVCVTGDGGFLFACGELGTVAQEQLDITVLVIDDGGYGMLRFDQVHAQEEPFGVDWPSPDFAALARAFGIAAHVVEGFGPEFGERLAECLSASGPNVIVVKASLRPPPTTYPRWYRRHDAEPAVEIVE